MIIAYTGTGKGKTSAAMGHVLRAIGHKRAVLFMQFIKEPGVAGEQIALADLLGNDFVCGGLGFITPENKEAQKAAAHDLLACVRYRVANNPPFLVILDEVLNCISLELITVGDLWEVIGDASGRLMPPHFVVSGRTLPNKITRIADYGTYMQGLKHPFQKGIAAIDGLDY